MRQIFLKALLKTVLDMEAVQGIFLKDNLFSRNC